MHANARLLRQLYDSLDQHNHQAMTDCYHPNATFQDIAFNLNGKDQIGLMWQMICSGDIRVTVGEVSADDTTGTVDLIDEYTFSETGKRVRNPIQSRFHLQAGLILEHRDACDARAWASQAIGGVGGFLAGRLHFLRAWKARSMLRNFVKSKAQAKAHGL